MADDDLDALMAEGLSAANAADDVDHANSLNGDGIGSVATRTSQLTDIDWKDRENQDDDAINRVIAGAGGGTGMQLNLDGFAEKQLDQTEKADDAVDYEDISDDDLPLDEDSPDGPMPASQVPALTEDEGTSNEAEKDIFGDDGVYDDGDLFGEGDHNLPPSSPLATTQLPSSPPLATPTAAEATGEVSDEDTNMMSLDEMRKINFNIVQPDITHLWVTEQSSHQDHPAPPENIEQLLDHTFPSFAKNKVLNFREVFAEWPAEYMYKEPPKSPPELVPTKLELELDGDTSKLFRIPDSVLATTQKKSQQYHGDEDDWSLPMAPPAFGVDDAMSDSDDEDERVGGYTLTEIATVCDDWDNIHEPSSVHQQNGLISLSDDEDDDEWTREFLQPKDSQPKKKRKYEPGLPDISSFDAWGIENFVEATKRSARRVELNMNDPYLLVDDMQSERPNKRPRLEEKTKRMANGQLGRDVRQRFNISNDDAYSALKANNKSKVRATLSNLAVEHSMPALKLTFPFYRTKVAGHFWEHHRKKFEVDKVLRHAINFRKPGRTKRRETKGRSVRDIFKTSKDLSLNDNSSAVLFEYCEQAPIMMSNFGMGSRVINYYRRKDRNDEEKPPKAEVGEPHVLLPEDRSPFSIFGTVEPGETVPTLHNEMYRAPIFKHTPRRNDFLLGYSTNAADGPRWYLKAIDHLYVVGQTFPSMDVPGPHARRVTNTQKNRLKMISYRMMRKRPTHDVGLKQITPHVFEKDDAQNRQKLKEFLHYDRDSKTWVMPEGQTLMDESGIRAMIKPEDVCLIEAMQIGVAQLHNAGLDPKDSKVAAAQLDEEEPSTEETLIAKMAPWEMTKNFIDASAGKAMVALHGEGDPTGHGLGFSFIRTSMKGGYINSVQGPLATSADAMERERKANGGHSYNVKKQSDMYFAAIHDIWGRQQATLSDTTTHEDSDVLDTANEDDRFNPRKQTSFTPAAPMDDGRSQLSRLSTGSRLGRRKLKITRKVKGDDGQIETKTLVIEDPLVIRSYMKQRKDIEEAAVK
ncbi:uncharacterized protein BCR38DRAFT_453158 [Pseudomassariella vexata]|uniref:Transcription initiation factor TFIID subunit 1 histone acetyltransferase domain-containing protein n=1 Tax=Pseudomassariella vexata TaxID=1141098 RepID=A0A1Y2D6C4_9PEZI|nr:uncharacterized protein BCR38DRAFT_453158 [Pseudomassariella vexata]ORY54820.1 hypothetical protein BCR38DRAFT_453158 [Pseudomassariella vexata]